MPERKKERVEKKEIVEKKKKTREKRISQVRKRKGIARRIAKRKFGTFKRRQRDRRIEKEAVTLQNPSEVNPQPVKKIRQV